MSKCPKGILRISFRIRPFPRANPWNRRSNAHVTPMKRFRSESAAFSCRRFLEQAVGYGPNAYLTLFLEQTVQCSRHSYEEICLTEPTQLVF